MVAGEMNAISFRRVDLHAGRPFVLEKLYNRGVFILKPNYTYPLDFDWTKDEMVAVTTFYSLVEDAYERGVNRENLLAAYRGFKKVVPDKGTEKQYDKQFEELTDYSTYRAVQAARKADPATTVHLPQPGTGK